jgi:hypothetical protein
MPENTPPDAGTPFDPFTVERLIAEPATARDAAEQDLATLFGALRARAEPHVLAREREHLAAFAAARALGTPVTTTRRRSVLTSFLATKTAVAAAAVAAVAGVGAAGAYTGSLPDRLQNVAHDTLGAPGSETRSQRPDTTPKPDPTPSRSKAGGVDATGAAAHGLCTAAAAGGLATTSTAYRSLAEAAGGASRIEAYCASIPAPGKPSAGPTGAPTDRPTGKPDDAGQGKPDDLRTGKPDDLRTGKPTARPSH